MKKSAQKPRRTRRDPRRAATQAAIIEKGEALFGIHGIDGVSLRQLGAAVGSGNSSVVAYHFGSKEALIEAIFNHRLPTIDERRGELLTEAEQLGRGDDLALLLRALWLPLFEQVDADGQHSYAKFIHALMRSDAVQQWLAVHNNYPATRQLLERLVAALPPPIVPLFPHRISISTITITGALDYIDRCQSEQSLTGPAPEAIFADVLTISAAALLAPPQPKASL